MGYASYERFPAIENFDMDHFRRQLKRLEFKSYFDSTWIKLDRDRVCDFSAEVLAFIYYHPLSSPIVLIPMSDDDYGQVEWNYTINLDDETLSIHEWRWNIPIGNLRLVECYNLDNLPLFFSENFGER